MVSSAEALVSVENLILFVVGAIFAAIYLIIIGVSGTNIFALSVSFMLGLNAFLGKITKDFFASIILLFISHPYDIGDKVKLDNSHSVYIVNEINILRSLFLDPEGELVSVPNASLVTKLITNLRRSPEQWESLDITFKLSITQLQLRQFRTQLSAFLKEHSNLFYSRFEVTPLDSHFDKYPVKLRVQGKYLTDMIRISDRRHLLLSSVSSIVEKIQIEDEKKPGTAHSELDH